jgi:hypothetical protein
VKPSKASNVRKTYRDRIRDPRLPFPASTRSEHEKGVTMIFATTTWPDAAVSMTLIAGVAVVVSVLIWSIFRTGQTAIKKELRQQEQRDRAAAGLDAGGRPV